MFTSRYYIGYEFKFGAVTDDAAMSVVAHPHRIVGDWAQENLSQYVQCVRRIVEKAHRAHRWRERDALSIGIVI